MKLVRWIWTRLLTIHERDGNYGKWFMIGFLIVTMTASVIQAVGHPTGATLHAHLTNIAREVSTNGMYFVIWTTGVGALLSFLYIPLPRLFVGSFSYTIYLSATLLIEEESGTLFSYIVGVGYSIVTIVVVLCFIVLFRKKNRSVKISILTGILFLTSMYVVLSDNDNETTSDLESISEENPAQKGDFPYTFFSYGSGEDKYREAFGEGVDIVTPAVDASSFITKWSEERTAFWGFDQSQLPVNGRVWLPEGEGPFPVILIVQGNHTMEYFSASGYDYLGELLASRGFVTITVDQDFINYSNTSGIPDRNYELRAWVILQHVAQLQTMNQTPGNAFYQKIDFDQVGLVGHSRGGQAAQMAADYESFFDDERLLESMDQVKIQGVVALAPTDKRIDGKRPMLDNTSYLLMQGARDGDVTIFRGERQYYQMNLDENEQAFRSSLYIADANHSQFNTNWGRMDSSLPRGLFLSRMQTMEPNDQQQIAKVYISAFFESVLHGDASFEKLFRDYRYGESWLPNTTFVNKYHHANYQSIIEFKRNKVEASDGVITVAEGFDEMDVITPEDRGGNDRPVDAVRLEWKDDVSYTVHLPDDYMKRIGWGSEAGKNGSRERLIFTMANIVGEVEQEKRPEIEVELKTTDGDAVQLPLDDFMPFPPVITTDYTPFGLFDDIFREGKYETSWEPVFQTFEVPLESFEQQNATFNTDNIDEIRLHFRGDAGGILLESVGWGQTP
ncbi:alpha/beta hydrolase family protein [Aquibacillus sediminis]|uniref:alpha/beta hydrolase family protein n=1 Tax=Aquibacillus sediminis TaxID=2574734 RepID=UPI0011095814|nr:hypothetical protein [Aquibacillus sediminis]